MSEELRLALFALSVLVGSGGMSMVAVKVLERRRTTAQAVATLAEAGESEARATDIIVGASERAVALLEQQLERALERIAILERRVLVLESENRELKDQLEVRPGGRRGYDPPDVES